MLSRVANSRSRQWVADAGSVAQCLGITARYVTDGVNLYRFLGATASGMGMMVGLEDCRSLEVVLLPIGELHARRMRAVEPVPG